MTNEAGPALETELKVGIPVAALAGLGQRLSTIASGGEQQHLRAIYYDTPDRRLKKANMALRVRGESGQLVQTVKAGRCMNAGFHQVAETDNIVKGWKPEPALITDVSIRTALMECLGGEELVPVFETQVERRIWHFPWENGVVEVALDEGRIVAGAATQAISEIEFELKTGEPETLFSLARHLLANEVAQFNLSSKAARGHGLTKGRAEPDLSSSKPTKQKPGLSARQGLEQAMNGLAPVIGGRLFQVFTDEHPEGPHQLRVALRRLRVVLALFRPVIDGGLKKELTTQARKLGQILSRIRDADVLIERIGRDDALAASLDRWRDGIRLGVRQELLDEAASGFVLNLIQLAALGGWGREGSWKADTLAAEKLTRMGDKAEKLGDRLAILGEEKRHEFRKLLKNIRYTIEFTSFAKGSKSFLSPLKQLQEDLGLLNDFSVLSAFDPALDDEAARKFLETRKAELMLEAQGAQDYAMGRACRHWKQFREQRPLWR